MLVATHFSQGAFHLMAWPVRPELLSLYLFSQISSENGPDSIDIDNFHVR
jgi:hypothetical protein